MENSTHSSLKEPLNTEETTVLSEEEDSSWTKYFEDFSASHNREESGSSVISDAASHAACKSQDRGKASGSIEDLRYKTRKAKGVVLHDDSLEDTASSPLSSPKVHGLNDEEMIKKKEDNRRDYLQEKAGGYGNSSELRREEMDELDYAECTELRKRGLCLVPLSMLVDYLG